MTADLLLTSEPNTSFSSFTRSFAPPRLRVPAVILGLVWIATLVLTRVDKPYFVGFLVGLIASALLVFSVFGWWFFNRHIRLADRCYGFSLFVGGWVLAAVLCHPSMRAFLVTGTLPLLIATTVWVAWLGLIRIGLVHRPRLWSPVIVCLAWSPFLFLRVEGLSAELRADLRLRWSPTAEDLFLAEQAKEPAKPSMPVAAQILTAQPGDWTQFRGAERDGVVHGVRTALDWRTTAPRLVWRRRVGPAWSSVIVVGNRLFTQEQRGANEAVVCYDAESGQPIWSHEDPARFYESVSGPGPRATPTFAEGRLYTAGATGLLNCLDAATGRRLWSRNVAAEAGATPPAWGYSSSPLVADGLVVAYAGGSTGRGLQAYQATDGTPAWAVPTGETSYSSPQRVVLDGLPQLLMTDDSTIEAVDPATGQLLWQEGLNPPKAPRAIQPHVISPTQLLVGVLDGQGVTLIGVSSLEGTWKVERIWSSTALKPEFPDLVVHDGHAYGFDLNIFCCIDLAAGKRCWKAGRYGRGQGILLADTAQLLVISEAGEAILLDATPTEHRERGKFQALAGKTWNHPVIAHGRLYVRNAEEMACYDLGLQGAP